MSLCAQLVGLEPMDLPNGNARVISDASPSKAVRKPIGHNMVVEGLINRQAILKAIAAGCYLSSRIKAETGLSAGTVFNQTRQLAKDRLITITTRKHISRFRLRKAGALSLEATTRSIK